MATTKSGDMAIPRIAWALRASAHQEFANSLSELLSAHAMEATAPLAGALDALKERHHWLALACEDLKKGTKRGRPRKILKPESPTSMLKRLLNSGPPKRRGRPSEYGPDFDKLTFKVVEQRREELGKGENSQSTIKAAIDSLNAQVATENSMRITSAIKGDFNRVHSAYQRGKKLSG